MSYYCNIIKHSVNDYDQELMTAEVRYPRFIHSELLTHRALSRNSASSRAIPWPKMCKNIAQNPVIPIRFGSEQKGMQTGGEIEFPETAEQVWLEARDNALKSAQELANLGVHKSICNRITEPFMFITVIITATDWKNFFRLRVHGDAEVHILHLAALMQKTFEKSTPEPLAFGQWHLPYVTDEEKFSSSLNIDDLKKCSVARCARVSYLTHDGVPDNKADLDLFEKLIKGSGWGHASPLEHVAMSSTPDTRSGNFKGWLQFRKLHRNECADN